MNKTLISTNATIFLFAVTHIFSDAITNMLSALLLKLQVLYGLTKTTLARTIGGRKGEVVVGLFSAGGTLGIALGPVIIIMMLFARYGLSYTPWLMLPGSFFGLLILFLTTEASEPVKAESSKLFDSRLILGPVGLLALTTCPWTPP